MRKLVWLNGEVQDLDNAVVPAGDHAHLYGDGLFEGIRIYGGKVFKLDEHLDRLYNGIKFLEFEMHISKSELKQSILDLRKESGIDAGYVRLNVTRGTGLGLDPRNIDRRPNVMIMISTLALYPKEAYELGLKAVTVSTRVFPAQCLDPRLKTIGRYVANIQAKLEANRQGAGEGIMLNTEGYLAEATGDNIFLIKNGIVRTPHISCGILGGITRQTVIDLARKDGLDVREEVLTLYDLVSADEAFLTGTAAEVIPLVSLDARKIGCGTPGETTHRIMALFSEA
ncbi:MAG TPA: branched-chain-amino-acid transaminase, partial [Fimbriimonadales bacterium]|nr:branched-chain-amino-acid transaminase [Fimbriimonadales bacterium]